MATDTEIKIVQKTALFDLLKLKRDSEKSGIKFETLDELIIKTEAVMEEEDVAYVEKKIAQLP